jgi:hypothetical protein
MSKHKLLIFVIPLILCLAGTFLLLKLNQNPSTKVTPITEIAGQTNFLLFQVDSLKSEAPELISIWAILIQVEEPTYVVFKRIAPGSIANTQTKDTQISFALEDGDLPVNFFSQSIQKLNLDIDSYFLLDTQAILALINDYTGQAVFSEGVVDDPVLTQVCSKLGQAEQNPASQIEWNNLIPLHMRTNLSFETFATIWEDLTRSKSAPHCEIINFTSENQTTP